MRHDLWDLVLLGSRWQLIRASCEPLRSYPADGKPHPVVGDPDVAA